MGERSGEIILIDLGKKSTQRSTALAGESPSPVTSLAFAPNSQTLAVGTRDQVRLWGLGGRIQPLIGLPGHRGILTALAFDASGNTLAGADEKTVKVWDLSRLQAELTRHGLGW